MNDTDPIAPHGGTLVNLVGGRLAGQTSLLSAYFPMMKPKASGWRRRLSMP